MIVPDGDEERRALEAFRREVEAYCGRAHGRVPAGIMSIAVVTAWEPSASFRRRVHQSAHRTVDALLPRMRVGRIDLRAARGLPATGWAFEFTPEPPGPPRQAPEPAGPELPRTTLDPRPAPERPADMPALIPAPRLAATRKEDPPLPPARPLGLILRYAGNPPWRYPVPAAEVWAPVGRWSDEEGDRWGLRFPSYAGFVPRGKLLYVLQHGDALLIARSGARPDYLVRVNGAVLRAGDDPVPAGRQGTIEYAKGAPPSTVLAYQVVPEGPR